MKKLLYILFFFISCNQYTYVYSQVSITEHLNFTNSTTNASSFGTSGATFTVGKLYLFVATVTGATNFGTITATTSTWDNVINVGDATRRIQVFRFMPSSTITSEAVNLGTFGGGQSGYSVVIYEIGGMATTGTNGADAIVQAVGQTSTTGANPSVTLSAISNPQNAVIAIFTNGVNPFNGTAESDWTENEDAGHNSPTTGVYIMQRHSTTDNTPTVTAASSTWIGAAIELNVVRQRRIISAQ